MTGVLMTNTVRHTQTSETAWGCGLKMGKIEGKEDTGGNHGSGNDPERNARAI